MIDADRPAPESGCNCKHLAEGARCIHCQERETTAGPQLWHDDDRDDDGPDAVLLTDGGRDGWHECDHCGAAYRDPKAAVQCCADRLGEVLAGR